MSKIQEHVQQGDARKDVYVSRCKVVDWPHWCDGIKPGEWEKCHEKCDTYCCGPMSVR